MDKNNEQKKNTNPETNQKQDNLKPWLKLLPAAAVFAAVCVTCYQTEKSPVETAVVSNNSIMSTDDIKELIATGNTHDEVLQESSAKKQQSISKNIKESQKASKIKPAQRKCFYRSRCKWQRCRRRWCRKYCHTNYTSSG